MVRWRRCVVVTLVLACGLGFAAGEAAGQPEVMAWGNLTGIRVDGQLMAFESSVRVVGAGEAGVLRTAKERQSPRYRRDGDRQIVATRLDSLDVVQVVTAAGRGVAAVEVELAARDAMDVAGVYFSIALPTDLAGGGTVALVDPADASLGGARPVHGAALRTRARGVRVEAPHRRLEVALDEPAEVIVDYLGDGAAEVHVVLARGPLAKGQTARRAFTITATGEIDRRPVALTLDTSRPGRPFDGLGGNFRIQNPETDPPVIAYNLDNLRVAWGRVEMPWRFWHPDEGADPEAEARAGRLHPRVAAAMEMAQELDRRGIPVLLAAWSGPDWAIVGPPAFGEQPGGLRGNPLDPAKTEAIYASLVAYVRYLRDAYGVAAVAFSFNESDLGINIRQSADEHAALIAGLGAAFRAAGLPTRLLLGDTADANGYAFTYAAAADTATYPYVFAVSFHSWRGWADETLRRWADLARRLDVPLVVGEGSIDAAAWRYPDAFEEPAYALREIDLYTRILALCQPLSILQWQLTADYSALAGGGVFGNRDEPLRPTQRFWNLKQLAATPPGLFALPITSSRADVTSAALGDPARGAYVVHLVNNGAAREAVLSGLPEGVRTLRVFVTDARQGAAEGAPIPVSGGVARFTLAAAGFTTLVAGAD